MTGRTAQEKLMLKILKATKSAFVAVTGRRRIGKTLLVDEMYKDHFCLRITKSKCYLFECFRYG